MSSEGQTDGHGCRRKCTDDAVERVRATELMCRSDLRIIRRHSNQRADLRTVGSIHSRTLNYRHLERGSLA